jgi:hypothetical protein
VVLQDTQLLDIARLSAFATICMSLGLASPVCFANNGGATTSNPAPEDADARLFSAAEREAFRNDLQDIQQQFYQATPESRRRWLQTVRERRQQLDLHEDQSSSGKSRLIHQPIPDPVRATVRAGSRDRVVE